VRQSETAAYYDLDSIGFSISLRKTCSFRRGLEYPNSTKRRSHHRAYYNTPVLRTGGFDKALTGTKQELDFWAVKISFSGPDYLK
jgi:hypothetical protein